MVMESWKLPHEIRVQARTHAVLFAMLQADNATDRGQGSDARRLYAASIPMPGTNRPVNVDFLPADEPIGDSKAQAPLGTDVPRMKKHLEQHAGCTTPWRCRCCNAVLDVAGTDGAAGPGNQAIALPCGHVVSEKCYLRLYGLMAQAPGRARDHGGLLVAMCPAWAPECAQWLYHGRCECPVDGIPLPTHALAEEEGLAPVNIFDYLPKTHVFPPGLCPDHARAVENQKHARAAVIMAMAMAIPDYDEYKRAFDPGRFNLWDFDLDSAEFRLSREALEGVLRVVNRMVEAWNRSADPRHLTLPPAFGAMRRMPLNRWGEVEDLAGRPRLFWDRVLGALRVPGLKHQ